MSLTTFSRLALYAAIVLAGVWAFLILLPIEAHA